MFVNANPLIAPVSRMAKRVAENRSPVPPDNPFLVMQKGVSDEIIAALDAWRDVREAWSEKMFFAIYGSPALQAALGIDPRPAGQGGWRPGAPCTRNWSAPALPN